MASTIILITTFLICSSVSLAMNLFNVLNFGAVGNGNTDDTAAFSEAWEKACHGSDKYSSIVVPDGKTFLVRPLRFTGPCNPKLIDFEVNGEIIAPSDPSSWGGENEKWITFENVDGLHVYGNGRLDGKGKAWWDKKCNNNYIANQEGCSKEEAPTLLSFMSCNMVTMENLRFMDSPQAHIHVYSSSQVQLKNLIIQAPGVSPNTDGINIGFSHDVSVNNATIGSGDDCIAIENQTWNISITTTTCGPGHGISIGSLGKDGDQVNVHDINVKGANFFGTMNGARIKTWQAGRGLVQKVSFSDMTFESVQNPIIIDQYYSDHKQARVSTNTGVQINDVIFSSGRGTSATQVAINLNCSSNVPCTNIKLEDIQLSADKTDEQEITAFCRNSKGQAIGVVQPTSCLGDLI